jgi:hypothetical protein
MPEQTEKADQEASAEAQGSAQADVKSSIEIQYSPFSRPAITIRAVWEPKEDITTHELARLQPYLFSLTAAQRSPKAAIDQLKELPDDLRRHWAIAEEKD